MNPVVGHRQPSFEYALRPVPPFRLDLTGVGTAAPSAQSDGPVGWYDISTVMVIGGRPTELAVRQVVSSMAPRLIVIATPAPRTSLERQQPKVIRSMPGGSLSTAAGCRGHRGTEHLGQYTARGSCWDLDSNEGRQSRCQIVQRDMI